MSSETPDKGIHELAGGWITERKGTKIPLFLKLSYVGFSIFGIAYLFLYAGGEVDHATRGPLVQQINQAMELPGKGWIGFIGVVVVAFVAGLFAYAFRSGDSDE
jgi:hypothetical protein